jgi:hypothetical protein
MTKLEMLQTDLEFHVKRRAQLAAGEGTKFIKRAGYSVEDVIDSYNRIIASIEADIVEIETKKTAVKKKPQAKKTPTKTVGKKKPTGKKKAKAAK